MATSNTNTRHYMQNTLQLHVICLMFANRFVTYNNVWMQKSAYTFLDLHRNPWNPYSKGIHRPLWTAQEHDSEVKESFGWAQIISIAIPQHFFLLPELELVQLTQKRRRAELAPDCLAFHGYQFKPWQDFHCLVCSCQCHSYSTKLLSFISLLENFCNIIKFFKHFLSHSRMLINHLTES